MKIRDTLKQMFGRGQEARSRKAGAQAVAGSSDDSVCVRCHQPITVDPALSRDVFEGMHWLCFHLEFEHDTDPDTRCGDVVGCPWWKIKHLEDGLRAVGLDPSEVVAQGLQKHFE